MKRIGKILAVIGAASALAASSASWAQQEIPRAPSTPATPKNWVGPAQKIKAQQLIDGLAAAHPEVMSITMHGIPAGARDYTMIAGTFPDRIGNVSSPGDVITAKKGVTQVESKWGTADFGKKVSVVLPLKSASGKYLPVAMVIAFKQSPTTGLIDVDFLQPAVRLRDSIASKIQSVEALYAPAALSRYRGSAR